MESAISIASVFSLSAQIAAASAHHQQPNSWPNSGKPRSKGATIEVLRYLAGHQEFRTAGEIMRTVGRSHSAICWAMQFLRQIGAVETARDSRRNPRYLMYRARADRAAALLR